MFLLRRTEASKAYRIELDAIVTYSDPEWGLLFVQDSTGTSFIDVHGSNVVYPLGARVRVQAVTDANENGITMAHPKIVVLGKGTLPKPDQRTVAELDAGVGEAHRVVTEGVLHPCERDWNRVCFRVYDGEKLVWLMVPQQDNPAAQSLLGATVRVKGMVGRHEDNEKRRVGAQLYVDALQDIEIESSPSPVSFSSSPAAIHDLRASDADERFARQIHLRGTVIWQSPGLFAIQDNSGILFVGTGKNIVVHTGNAVDAIGFPSHGRFGLELSDSAVRLAPGQPNVDRITPLQVTAADVIKRSLSGRRVRIKARLTDQSASATELVYQLEDGQQRFNAVLLRNDAAREIVSLSRDSVLDLTGVALIQNGTAEWPGALLVLIESPKDIVLIRGGDWLTLKQRLAIGFAMGFLVVATLAWVTLLRRTVRKQTAIIRARLENELQLETKYRRLFERNLAAVFSWRARRRHRRLQYGVCQSARASIARRADRTFLLGFPGRLRTSGATVRSFSRRSIEQS